MIINPSCSESKHSQQLSEKNEVILRNRDIDNASIIFKDTYTSCSKGDGKKIDKALCSEDNRIYLYFPVSVIQGVAQKHVEGIAPADIAYFIFTSETSKNNVNYACWSRVGYQIFAALTVGCSGGVTYRSAGGQSR